MKQYVVAMTADFKEPPTFEEFLEDPKIAKLKLEKQKLLYLRLRWKMFQRARVKLLDTGKLYTLEEAQAVVEKLQKTCQPELKHLDFDRFVVYNVNTPTE